jgi:RNA polymerase sigma factor (sigma-70 family)
VELEDVFREHQRSVYAYFLRVVGDRHDAEELTQETFFRACGAAIRYRGDGSVRSWLFGIARRVLMEASRRGLFDRATVSPEVEIPSPETDHAERLDLELAFSNLDARRFPRLQTGRGGGAHRCRRPHVPDAPAPSASTPSQPNGGTR